MNQIIRLLKLHFSQALTDIVPNLNWRACLLNCLTELSNSHYCVKDQQIQCLNRLFKSRSATVSNSSVLQKGT
jgi:hypothetical protein